MNLRPTLNTPLLAAITTAALVPFLGMCWLDRESLVYTFRGHLRLLDNFCGIQCINGELWVTLGHDIPPSGCAPPGCSWESKPGIWGYRSYYLAIIRHETKNVWEEPQEPTPEELRFLGLGLNVPPVGSWSGAPWTRDWSGASIPFHSGPEPPPKPRAKSIYSPTLSYFGCIAVQREIDYRQCPWVYIAMPIWVLSSVTGAVASLVAMLCGCRYLLVLRRARRVRAGFCGRCGYDLRASPGECPECGAPRACHTLHVTSGNAKGDCAKSSFARGGSEVKLKQH